MTKKKVLKRNRTTVHMTSGIDKFLPENTYRARKVVNGTRLSKSFPKLKDAKTWLKAIA